MRAILDGREMEDLLQSAYALYSHGEVGTMPTFRSVILSNSGLLRRIGLTREEVEPYLYPLFCGLKLLKSTGTLTLNGELFINAWEWVRQEVYYNFKNWGPVKIKATNGFLDKAKLQEYEQMLDVSYEIIRNLPFSNHLKKQNQKEMKQEIDKLYEDVASYRESINFGELLKFITRFPKIAPYNAMLINMQDPGSQFVASASQWRERFGRYPKPGARPLIILQTFGPVSYVYDVGQTEGNPLPEKITKPFTIKGHADELWWNYKRAVFKEEISYCEQDYGPTLGGFIKVNDEDRSKPLGTFRNTRSGVLVIPHEYDIVVNSNFSKAQKCAVLFHELGHYFCGHLWSSPLNKTVPNRYDLHLDTQTKEFEAETVNWLLCKRAGIDNPSASYLENYLDNNYMIPKNISIDTILKAVGKIEKLISAGYKGRYEKLADHPEIKRPKEESLF